MDPLRYHTEVHLEENTSHSLVVELVGRNKRVLDVGCATGAIGKVLTDRGCVVVGVEPEGAAAEVAKQFLAEVLVGTLDELDLPGRFSNEPFDIVIVADVLEHLVDPLGALTTLFSVLAPGGSVVASIPNVAHGAVRLALLQGRFDYTDVGLLDRTHVHFFTKETVEQLFDDAGLSIVEMRRTTAEIFATEIPLIPEEIDQRVVQSILDDPEATTYQFVVKAIPTVAGAESRSRMLELEQERLRLHELEHEVARLREAARPHAASLPGRGAQVGLWGYFDTRHPADQLRLAVHRHELQRRLPNADIRAFAPFGEGGAAIGGLVIESLGQPTTDRYETLVEELDAVIAIGRLTARADEIGERYGDAPADSLHPGQFLARMLPSEEADLVLFLSDVSADLSPSREDDRNLINAFGRAALVATSSDALRTILRREGTEANRVPDTIRLIPRALDRGLVNAALAADASGLADERYVLIRAGDSFADAPDGIIEALRRLVGSEPRTKVVVCNVDGGHGEGRFTATVAAAIPGVIQILQPDAALTVGLVANASGVATDAEWLLELAAAYEVPSVFLGSAPDSRRLVEKAELLGFEAVRPDAQPVADRLLQAHFDDLAEKCRELEIRVRPPAWPLLVGRLEATERALGEQLRQAGDLRMELGEARAAIAVTKRGLASTERRASLLQDELLRRNDELVAIHGSKLWRVGTFVRRIRHLVRRLTP